MSPEQQFKSQISDMESSDFHVTYEVEANIGGYGDIVSGMINDPEVYKKGDQSKFVVDVSGVTAAGYDFFEGNRSAVCTQGSILGGLLEGSVPGDSSSESKVSCDAMNTGYANQDDFEEGLDEFNMTVTGTKTVADRECTNYRFKPSGDVNETLEDTDVPRSSTISQYSDSQINICLDNQKGYPALLNVKDNQSSELRESGMKELVSVKATAHDTDFEGVSMEVPVDISASMSCDPVVNVTSFGYSGDVQISFNGEENVTRQIESDSQISVELNSDNLVYGSNEVEVSTGDETTTASCYDYETDYDYDYNFTSDYDTDYNYSY
ncbi:MAG: hypothetical protein BRC30_00515 [Nanohaloarchaea archaeon SW_7_46_7]|nr:MAG: hypothetical protein BRC30_00515 [Nanohaloarchaea archaeon SW_7_46_7]